MFERKRKPNTKWLSPAAKNSKKEMSAQKSLENLTSVDMAAYLSCVIAVISVKITKSTNPQAVL